MRRRKLKKLKRGSKSKKEKEKAGPTGDKATHLGIIVLQQKYTKQQVTEALSSLFCCGPLLLYGDKWPTAGPTYKKKKEKEEKLIRNRKKVKASSSNVFFVVKYVGVIWLNSHVLQLLPIRVTTYQSPTFSFKFAPIPRPCPSTTTYAHPCPPIAWHVRTHAHPCYSNCAHVFKNCVMCITRLHQVLVGSDK